MRRSERNQLAQGIEDRQPVDVHVGQDAVDRNGRVLGEIVASEEAHLFAGDGEEHHRATRPRGEAGERARDLEQRRHARGVVQHAVVDRIAADRLADSEVIQVRGEEDELAAEPGVGSPEDTGDVGTLEPLVRAHRPHRRREREIEGGRPPCRSRVQYRGVRLRRPLEQHRCGGIREGGHPADLGKRILRGPVRSDPSHRPAPGLPDGAVPGERHIARAHDQQPDCSVPHGVPGLDPRRGMVSALGGGKRPRCAGQQHDDLSPRVYALVIVVGAFRRRHAEAGEHQWSGDLRLRAQQIGRCDEVTVPNQLPSPRRTVESQRALHRAGPAERYGLQVAIGAAGLEAEACELSRDVASGLRVSARPRAAPLETVGAQHADVRLEGSGAHLGQAGRPAVLRNRSL
jgi:hypothetical protein